MDTNSKTLKAYLDQIKKKNAVFTLSHIAWSGQVKSKVQLEAEVRRMLEGSLPLVPEPMKIRSAESSYLSVNLYIYHALEAVAPTWVWNSLTLKLVQKDLVHKVASHLGAAAVTLESVCEDAVTTAAPDLRICKDWKERNERNACGSDNDEESQILIAIWETIAMTTAKGASKESKEMAGMRVSNGCIGADLLHAHASDLLLRIFTDASLALVLSDKQKNAVGNALIWAHWKQQMDMTMFLGHGIYEFEFEGFEVQKRIYDSFLTGGLNEMDSLSKAYDTAIEIVKTSPWIGLRTLMRDFLGRPTYAKRVRDRTLCNEIQRLAAALQSDCMADFLISKDKRRLEYQFLACGIAVELRDEKPQVHQYSEEFKRNLYNAIECDTALAEFGLHSSSAAAHFVEKAKAYAIAQAGDWKGASDAAVRATIHTVADSFRTEVVRLQRSALTALERGDIRTRLVAVQRNLQTQAESLQAAFAAKLSDAAHQMSKKALSSVAAPMSAYLALQLIGKGLYVSHKGHPAVATAAAVVQIMQAVVPILTLLSKFVPTQPETQKPMQWQEPQKLLQLENKKADSTTAAGTEDFV